MSEYPDFREEKKTIDSYFDKGYQVIGIFPKI